jgi:hypothetical protein
MSTIVVQLPDPTNEIETVVGGAGMSVHRVQFGPVIARYYTDGTYWLSDCISRNPGEYRAEAAGLLAGAAWLERRLAR